MKKNLLLVSLLAFITILSSCSKAREYLHGKKGHGYAYGHGKHNPPTGTLCDSLPEAVGTVYAYTFEVGTYVFQISDYYTNPTRQLPIGDTATLKYTVNAVDYFTDKYLVWADINNLGSFSFGAAFAPSAFTDSVAISIVYGSIIGTTCTPTQYVSALSIKTTAQTTTMVNPSIVRIEGVTIVASNPEVLKMYLKTFDMAKFKAGQKATLERFQRENK